MRLGLIRGRHEMPVDSYIFESSIEDVHNYNAISLEIASKLLGYESIEVYITGLTPVTVELVKHCIEWGIGLTLYNYDVETKNYIPQYVCGSR